MESINHLLRCYPIVGDDFWIQAGEEFRTRGVFFRHDDSKVAASLVVFATRKTKADNFPIQKLPPDVAVKDGSHVEVTARFVVVD